MRSFFRFPPPVAARELLWVDVTFGLLMLAAALFAQYGFSLYPCHLCMLQRYPYAVIVTVGIGVGFYAKSEKTVRYAVLLCAALLLLDAGIAFYHAGVEAGVFPAPNGCASDAKGGQTIEDMRKAIMDAPLVTCDQAMTHIFGLSLAAWNGLAALTMAVLTVIAYRKLKS